MEVKQVKLVYFSPTGTTQKVLEGIAKGLSQFFNYPKEPRLFGIDGDGP